MSQFSSFKDYVFTYLFPYYYRVNDTYRDPNGKGILQRFIETCSEYFDTEIIADATQKTPGDEYQPGLDNIVNLIDVEKTPELFLNYLWEFLGEIPYAYGLIVQGKVYDKLDLEGWLFNNPYFPQADPRLLLKYAISLYKIRGTEAFYRILGKYYGVIFELIETTNGGSSSDHDEEPNHDHLVLATYNNSIAVYTLGSDTRRSPYFDGDCTSCLYFKLKIGIGRLTYENLVSRGVLQAAVDVLVSIVEKYLPIHCQIGTYSDQTPKVEIEVHGDYNIDYNDDYDIEPYGSEPPSLGWN